MRKRSGRSTPRRPETPRTSREIEVVRCWLKVPWLHPILLMERVGDRSDLKFLGRRVDPEILKQAVVLRWWWASFSSGLVKSHSRRSSYKMILYRLKGTHNEKLVGVDLAWNCWFSSQENGRKTGVNCRNEECSHPRWKYALEWGENLMRLKVVACRIKNAFCTTSAMKLCREMKRYTGRDFVAFLTCIHLLAKSWNSS